MIAKRASILPGNSGPPIGATLSSFWQKYGPQLTSTGLGAGIGAAALGGISGLSDEKDPAVRRRNLRDNLLLGTVLGGAGGLAVGSAKKMMDEPAPGPGLLRSFLGKSLGSSAVHGAGAATLANAAAKTQNIGHAPAGKLTGQSDKRMKALLDEFKGEIGKLTANPEAIVDHVSTPASAGTATRRLPSEGPGVRQGVETTIRSQLDNLIGSRGMLGRGSQVPWLRSLGLNTADNVGERAALDALRDLSRTAEGQGSLRRILGPQAVGPGRALPLLQEELLHQPNAAGEILSRANRRSAIGRLGSGAALFTLLSKLLSGSSTQGQPTSPPTATMP